MLLQYDVTQDIGTAQKLEAICDNIPRVRHGSVGRTITLLIQIYSDSCRYCDSGSDMETSRGILYKSQDNFAFVLPLYTRCPLTVG